MKRLLVGLAPTIVVLVHALAPPSADACWGRYGSYYSSRYYGYGNGCGYSTCYRPSYYGYSNCNGYSNYGYSGYSPYGGYGGYGGMGGNSALTTILAMNGGLGGANTSMYMTVPMSNGYGPASLLQVPVGGGAGRPTYLQVPVGGGPGQPVYLQMEMGGGSQAPAAYAPTKPLGDATVPSGDRLAMDEPLGAGTTVPYVVAARQLPESVTVVAGTANDSSDEVKAPSRSIFRLAVLEREQDASTKPTTTPAKTAGFESVTRPQPVVTDEPIDLGATLGTSVERSLSDGAAPWTVK